MLPGHATAAGTARYRDRFANLRDAGHFRQAEHVPGVSQLWLSSIGLGTYLGDPSDAADQAYMAAIEAGLRSGINVLDTAINYRHQRSERNIGSVLKHMVGSGELHRDEVLVCTKAGYLSFDGNPPPDPRAYFQRAIAAARPQERMQIRRMADASLALAERRPSDLKEATEVVRIAG